MREGVGADGWAVWLHVEVRGDLDGWMNGWRLMGSSSWVLKGCVDVG